MQGTNNTATSVYGLKIDAWDNTGTGNVFTNAFGIHIIDMMNGQDASTISDTIHIEAQDGTHKGATKGNIRMAGGDWDTGHIQLGAAHIWFNGTNILGKVSAPTNGTDGTTIV